MKGKVDVSTSISTCMSPVFGTAPRILILGSMPGEKSLQERRYYAHPRNAFWPIMEGLFGIAQDAPYETRLYSLRQNQVALWDVVYTCTRKGSLDSSIEHASVVPNDLKAFIANAPSLEVIAFNGKKAKELFHRHFPDQTLAKLQPLYLLSLPSTSPAFAALSREAKLEKWRTLLNVPNGR